MSTNSPPTTNDAYVLEQVFPDAAGLLNVDAPPLHENLESCDVVLDANVLLLPYRTGQESIDQISSVYRALAESGRLFVPAQAAREYAKHRAGKIADIYQALEVEKGKPRRPNTPSFPLLGGLDEFASLKGASEALKLADKEYRRSINLVQERLKEWGWNDPVAQMYRSVFTDSEVVREQALGISEVRRRFTFRCEHKIPPGYKDASKADGGIGDYLIWLTILEIGCERKRPLVFVTHEEKSDWQQRTGGQGFLPRFELMDEYRRASQGQPFYLVPLSQVLSLMDVGDDVVEEILEGETRRSELDFDMVNCPSCNAPVPVWFDQEDGFPKHLWCEACGVGLSTHLTGTESLNVSVSKPQRRSKEVVACPNCGDRAIAWIGLQSGSSSWSSCTGCGEDFHVHRGHKRVFTRRRGGQGADLMLSQASPDNRSDQHEPESDGND